MGETIRIGIIGAGQMARQHLDVLKSLPEATVVGITSRTRIKAQKLAEEFNIPHCVNTWHELIDQVGVDAVLVLVSAEEMFGVLSQLMTFKVPLFIEKPAGLTPSESKQLVEIAKENYTKTMVGYNRRFYSIFNQGLDIIRQHGPLLGVAIEGHERFWRIEESIQYAPVVRQNWVYANSTHTIDLLRFFGGDVKEIWAETMAYKHAMGDQIAATIKFVNGAIGQYRANWYSPGGWSVVLYGDGVTVEFKPLEKAHWIDKDFKTHELIPNEYDIKFKPGFYGQMKAFIEYVKTSNKPWPMMDIEDAYASMMLAEQLVRNVKPYKG